MKKIFLIAVLMLLCCSIVYSALPNLAPKIKVTLLSQEPDPVEPGQVFKVKFKIENEGKETAEDVVLKIFLQYPFSVYSGPAEKNIGKLKAAQTGADAVIVEFELKADEKATEKKTELEVSAYTGVTAVSYTSDEFLINIQTHDAVLEITSVVSEPKQIVPGGTAKVSLTVKNLADSLLKDIKIQADFSGSSLPLAPYQSSSEKTISQLESNYQKALTFDFIASPNAAQGLYKIPLNITYNDENGKSYQTKDILAVLVGEEPQIRAYLKKSSALQANKEGKITLEIANAGMTNVKFLELFILPSEDYQLISASNYFYIGDIDSDDTSSEEINLYVNKKVKTLNLPVKIKYTGANNQNYQQQINLKAEIYTKSQLKKYGLIQNGSAYLYLIPLLLVISAYFLHRYYKKKKR